MATRRHRERSQLYATVRSVPVAGARSMSFRMSRDPQHLFQTVFRHGPPSAVLSSAPSGKCTPFETVTSTTWAARDSASSAAYERPSIDSTLDLVTEEDERFVAQAIYVPPKDPKWEAIEIGEVHRRIRGALGDASDELLESLSVAAMMSIPPPSEIVKYLTDAVAALNGVWSIFDITAANKASLPMFGELRETVFDFIGLLQALRDRG
jgi:hypothetical protein